MSPDPSLELAGRSLTLAVILGLLLGQAGYLYTRQGKRFIISTLLAIVAIALASWLAYRQAPNLLDAELMVSNPTEWQRQLESSLYWPTVVGVLNNVACAVDLYLQIWLARR